MNGRRFSRPRFSGGSNRGFGGGGRDRDRGFRSFEFEKPVKVGEEYDVEIKEVGSRGDGIARVKNFVIFVPNAKEGENIKVRIKEVRRRFAIAEKVGEGAPAEEKAEEAPEEEAAEPEEAAEEEAPEEEAEPEPTEEVEEAAEEPVEEEAPAEKASEEEPTEEVEEKPKKKPKKEEE